MFNCFSNSSQIDEEEEEELGAEMGDASKVEMEIFDAGMPPATQKKKCEEEERGSVDLQ